MQVYLVETDVNNFQMLEQDLSCFPLDVRVQKSQRLFQGVPMTEPLTPPEVYSRSPKLLRGDFWAFAPFSAIAMTQVAVDKVRRFMEDAGELLPLPYRQEVFSVLNILKRVDCLDKENPDKNKLYTFLPDKVPDGIFSVPHSPYILIAERPNETNNFKAFVKSEGMTGLKFRPIWESSDLPEKPSQLDSSK